MTTFEAVLSYVGVFILSIVTAIGIPGPGDGALVAAGIASAEGKLRLITVVIVGFTGGVLGCELGYRLGCAKGRKLLTGPGPFAALRLRALTKGEALLTKYDRIASFLVPSLICGISRVPRRSFFIYSTLSRLWWAVSTTVAAYYLGEGLTLWLRRVTHTPQFAIIASLAVLTVALRWWWVQRRTESPAT